MHLELTQEPSIPAFRQGITSTSTKPPANISTKKDDPWALHIDLIHDQTHIKTQLDAWMDEPSSRPSSVQGLTRYGSLQAYLDRFPGNRGRPTITVVNVGDRLRQDRVMETLHKRGLDPLLRCLPLLACTQIDGADVTQMIELGFSGFITPELDDPLIIQGMLLTLCGGLFIPNTVVKAIFRDLSEDSDNTELAGKEIVVSRYEHLTIRERQVFAIMRIGKSNKMIASELGLKESTVKVHVRNIMQKFKATSRTHVVYLANRLN